MTAVRAIVIEDEPSWQDVLTEILHDLGLPVDVAGHYAEAEEKLRAVPHRLAIVDLSLVASDHNNRDGLRLLDVIRRVDPGCTAILLTGFATVEIAVDAIRTHGAYTCLRKDQFRRAAFRQAIHQALAFVAPPPEPASAQKARPPSLAPARPALGKALLVEDDAGWRSVLAELLAEAGYQVHTSASYVEALGRLKQGKYHLAIVDLSLASSIEPLHNQDGYRLLACTRQANIPTLIVSGYAEPERVAQAYTDFNVFACLEKQRFDRAAFFQRLAEMRQASQAQHDLANLTAREREVLELLARGLSNKDLAAALHVTHNTVKRHLKAIFKKLNVQTRAAAVAKLLNPA